jgi:hypothetical protein
MRAGGPQMLTRIRKLAKQKGLRVASRVAAELRDELEYNESILSTSHDRMPRPRALVSVRKEVESDESDVIQGWWPGSGGAADVDMREPPQIQS